MANFNPTNMEKALKVKYGPKQLYDLSYSDRPFLALCQKDEEMRGRSGKEITPKLARNGGRSRTFATAQSNKTAATLKSFAVTRVKDYAIAGIDGELIEASKGDPNSFMEAVSFSMDDAIEAASNNLAVSMFRDSSGAIGQVSVEPTENASTFDVVLKQAQDVSNFEINQSIVIWSLKSGGAQRSSDGSDDEWLISKVDRDSGTLTLVGDYDGSGDIAADDYLFIEGDRGLAMSGLESWLPYSAPSASESFFGVDRSVDPTRLAGIRLDISGSSVEEGLIDLCGRIGREGIGKVSHIFVNNDKYTELIKELGSKVIYDRAQSPNLQAAHIGFDAVVIDTSKGKVKVISDHNCPYSYAYALDMRHVYLGSAGPAVKLLASDGNRILRISNEDGYEVRVGGYSNMYIVAPGSCGVGSF